MADVTPRQSTVESRMDDFKAAEGRRSPKEPDGSENVFLKYCQNHSSGL